MEMESGQYSEAEHRAGMALRTLGIVVRRHAEQSTRVIETVDRNRDAGCQAVFAGFIEHAVSR